MKRPRVFGATLVALLVLPLAFVTSAVGQAAVNEAVAFATGSIMHADLLQSGDTRLVNTEAAFSGVAFDSSGFAGDVVNELGRTFVPKAAEKTAFGQATALELGIGTTGQDDNQLMLAGPAKASAPPRVAAVTEEAGPADLAPLVWANLLRSRAAANTTSTPCALGSDASTSLGYIADAQFLDTAAGDDAAAEAEGLKQPLLALDATDPARAVSQSLSRSVLVAQRDKDGKLLGDAFGIMSEVRQTIAPVTLFRGTEYEVTIELLGEWVMQAVALGLPGQAFVHYGPAKETPETPIARIIQADGVETLLTTQDITGPEGFQLEIPGVAEIAVGEAPRKIGGAFGSTPMVNGAGVDAAAAADVIRVRALPDAPVEITDLRIGHMETHSSVPAGGLMCAIPVKKTPSKGSVEIGESFDMTFNITNPYDCTLTGVDLSDVITTEDGARFEVTSTDPATGLVSGTSGELSWADIGDIAPRESREIKATMVARGGAGRIIDTATASAGLADCAQAGATVAGVDVGLVGAAIEGASNLVTNPTVEVGVLSASGERAGGDQLPRTGAAILSIVLGALALIATGGVGIVLRRIFR